jgi:hypothetical protein
VPDYSAVIRDDCTYLEISAQTYLLAYKSTLLSRQKNEKDASQSDAAVIGAQEIPVNKITSEGYLEEVWTIRKGGDYIGCINTLKAIKTLKMSFAVENLKSR